ncbi:MAG: hypothetical protein ACYC7H_12875, partial [Chloroflexota bacterium]
MTDSDNELDLATEEQDLEVPLWKLRGYKCMEDIASGEEWERYVARADAQLFSGGLAALTLTRRRGNRAVDVARLVALRRRLTEELKAGTVLEQMLVDL